MSNRKRLEKILGINTNQIIKPERLLDKIEKNFMLKNLLPLNSIGFDELLRGGFCPGKMYLVYGANKTGKTQLCHQLSLQAVKNGKQAYYLDTENTFRAERIVELAQVQQLNPESILKWIKVSKINSNTMLSLAIGDDIRKTLKNTKNQLVLVDSINNYFRYEIGLSSLKFSKVKEIFMQILTNLQEITTEFETITVATAQITPNFLTNAILKELPVGNQYLNHFFSEYLYFRRKSGNVNQAHITNSQYLPEKIIKYIITEAGITSN